MVDAQSNLHTFFLPKVYHGGYAPAHQELVVLSLSKFIVALAGSLGWSARRSESRQIDEAAAGWDRIQGVELFVWT